MWKQFLQFVANKGVSWSYSTGKPFNPRKQKRTDGLRDIIESNQRKKRGKHGSTGQKNKEETQA